MSVKRSFSVRGGRVSLRSLAEPSDLPEVPSVGAAADRTTIAPRDRRVGWITMGVAEAAHLKKMQFTLDSGFGPEAGEWLLQDDSDRAVPWQ